MGDSTNMVLIFAGELLKKSEHLLVMGLHPSEIIKGYELACVKAVAELESKHACSSSWDALVDTAQISQKHRYQVLSRKPSSPRR